MRTAETTPETSMVTSTTTDPSGGGVLFRYSSPKEMILGIEAHTGKGAFGTAAKPSNGWMPARSTTATSRALRSGFMQQPQINDRCDQAQGRSYCVQLVPLLQQRARFR